MIEATTRRAEDGLAGAWLGIARRTMALASAFLFATSACADDARRKVVIDDDGFGLAQWMMIESPDVEVLGITVVAGDVARDEGIARAMRGLAAAGRGDIPLVPGATCPLLNSEKKTVLWEALYGKLEWKGFWSRPHPQPGDSAQAAPSSSGGENPARGSIPRSETAAEFLVKTVHRFPGAVTVVATGPMTNIALAQLLDPDFASLAKELVYMGGSLNPRQVRSDASAASSALEFVDSPRREFNFRFDPEAASIALQAPWRHITMVPVDPSTATELTAALVNRMSPGTGPSRSGNTTDQTGQASLGRNCRGYLDRSVADASIRRASHWRRYAIRPELR